MNQANFKIMNVGPDKIVIRDVGPWDQHPSVTNDAEGVVERLAAEDWLPPGRRLFYYDSDNQLDEILIEAGRFAGFAPGPRDRAEQMQMDVGGADVR